MQFCLQKTNYFSLQSDSSSIHLLKVRADKERSGLIAWATSLGEWRAGVFSPPKTSSAEASFPSSCIRDVIIGDHLRILLHCLLPKLLGWNMDRPGTVSG